MNTMIAAKPWAWNSEVLEYADRYGLRPYLDELLAMTRRMFPTASSIEVFTEPDREINDLMFLVFEVYVPEGDVPDDFAMDRNWSDAYHSIVPGPYQANICFSLRLVPA
jgi:hypothetical protein